MERALISRRLTWSCSGIVEVAPRWSLGCPPPYGTHFLLPHHFKLFLRAARDAGFTVSESPISYIRPILTDKTGLLGAPKLAWFHLFNPRAVVWNNFRYVNIKPKKFQYHSNAYWFRYVPKYQIMYADHITQVCTEVL